MPPQEEDRPGLRPTGEDMYKKHLINKVFNIRVYKNGEYMRSNKKNISTLFLALLVFSLNAQEAKYSDNDKCNIGLSIWNNGYSNAEDIEGGYYISSGIRIITSNLLFKASYDTNILTNMFSDKIINTSLYYKAIGIDEELITAIGMTYLVNLDEIQTSNYIGLSIIPITTWKSSFDESSKINIYFLPFSILYGLQNKDFLWSFTFFNIDFYF